MKKTILALYDCRSKQEYIYRTNRIREISGGSALLSGVYNSFIKLKNGIRFANGGKWEGLKFSLKEFEESENDAEVVYSGGGNLMVLYKSREIYVRANQLLSRMLLKTTYSISAIASCTEVTGDFKADRDRLYAHNAVNKSTGRISLPCAVLPFTQVDSLTYMPIVEKNRFKQESLSCENVCKYKAFDGDEKNKLSVSFIDDLAADKGRESLIAVIYIDGNNMGARLKARTEELNDYDRSVNALREFSCETNKAFVDVPISRIEEMLKGKFDSGIKYAKYRKVIAGGDEITLICNARIVPDILDTYFKALDSEKSGNYACAGVAIAHSKAPFADIYEIAEQCCESGKKRSRAYGSNANFIDFHFCRAGITNDMETIREKQESELTLRPYRIDGQDRDVSYGEFTDFAKALSKTIRRANIKELASSMIRSNADYRFEVERINSRYDNIIDNSEKTKKLIFDIAQIYDIWFAEEGQ